MKLTRPHTPLLLALALTTASHAHHGQDFFVTLDTRVPDLGHGSTFISTSWAKTSGADETEISPGILTGLGHGLAIGTTFQLSNPTPGSFGYAGITPLLQWSAPIPHTPLRIGATASYHFADTSHTTPHHTLHQHTTPTPDPTAPGGNPDAPTPGTGANHIHGTASHTHDGIHRHGEDHFTLRLISEWQPTPETRLLLNLITVGTSRDDIDLGYAIAIRHELTPRLATGLEIIGDLDTHGRHETIAGIYYTPHHHITLRLGAGTGLTPTAPDITLHTGLTWRF